MSGGFKVDTGAMRSHAGQLDGIAASGMEGVDAGSTVACGGDAFGIICGFIGAALNPVEAAGIANALVAAGSVKSTAVGIRAMAATYDGIDAAVEQGFKKIGGN